MSVIKSLTVAALAIVAAEFTLAGESAAVDAGAMPLTNNIKRAKKVEVLSVSPRLEQSDLNDVTARLTFADGSTVECRYSMNTKVVTQRGKAVVQFLPRTETCSERGKR